MILLREQPKEKAFPAGAESDEISNLKLVDDIIKILEFIDSEIHDNA
jgi:hypothetical protein